MLTVLNKNLNFEFRDTKTEEGEEYGKFIKCSKSSFTNITSSYRSYREGMEERDHLS